MKLAIVIVHYNTSARPRPLPRVAGGRPAGGRAPRGGRGQRLAGRRPGRRCSAATRTACGSSTPRTSATPAAATRAWPQVEAEYYLRAESRHRGAARGPGPAAGLRRRPPARGHRRPAAAERGRLASRIRAAASTPSGPCCCGAPSWAASSPTADRAPPPDAGLRPPPSAAGGLGPGRLPAGAPRGHGPHRPHGRALLPLLRGRGLVLPHVAGRLRGAVHSGRPLRPPPPPRQRPGHLQPHLLAAPGQPDLLLREVGDAGLAAQEVARSPAGVPALGRWTWLGWRPPSALAYGLRGPAGRTASPSPCIRSASTGRCCCSPGCWPR